MTRHLGWKTKRIHHTLSNFERMYLYFLEWVDEVVDIREQFPLTPLESTQEISYQLGIKHANVDGVPVVMTTDFVITVKTPKGLIDIVRTVKPASKLTKRTLEIFEIESRFFIEQGVSWGIILGNNLPKNLISNIEWLHEGRYLDTRPGVDEELVDLIGNSLFLQITEDNCSTSIGKIYLRCDDKFGIEPGTSMFILKHMLAIKKWGTDMKVKIKESKPLQIFNLEEQQQFINRDIS
ncbi:TnsA endonuclease N-terminal domain-containing protein [Psychrobacillus sp. PGGUH221]|uniref:TnsA endonuclease N-terminal domain-containing protein n=1 Tax=Psychrobacillus sp. PGGUH221 TaxID=3020058 RepID=UPI0035C73583